MRLDFLLMVLLTASGSARADQVDPRVRAFLGKGTDTVLNATRVEVFRLDPDEAPRGKRKSKFLQRIGGYAVTAKGHDLSQELVERLQELLVSASTYDFPPPPPRGGGGYGSIKLCGGFRPGVAFRFQAGEGRARSSVDVLLCFSCDEIGVVDGKRGNTKNADDFYPDGISIRDIEPGHFDLLELSARALPDDRELVARNRKERRSVDGRRRFQEALPETAREIVRLQGPMKDVVAGTNYAHEISKAGAQHLLERVAPDVLILASMRALAAVDDYEDTSSDMLTEAVRQLGDAAFLQVLRGVADDDAEALLGAARLVFLGAVKLPRPWRDTYLPRLARTALARGEGDDYLRVLSGLEAAQRPVYLKTLREIAAGIAGERTPSSPWSEDPSLRVSAALLLSYEGEFDEALAADLIQSTRKPDQVALALAWSLAQEKALPSGVFQLKSDFVGTVAVAALADVPDQRALDELIRHALFHPYGRTRDSALAQIRDRIGPNWGFPEKLLRAQPGPEAVAWWNRHRRAVLATRRAVTVSKQISKAYLGEGVRLISAPSQVDVYRIEAGDARGSDQPSFHGYRVRSGHHTLGAPLANAISRSLLSDSTYATPRPCPPGERCSGGKGCIFAPGVGYRFWSPGRARYVDVLICFTCDDLEVRWPSSHPGGESVVHGRHDFTPGHAVLQKHAREAFPDDPELRGLLKEEAVDGAQGP